MAKEELHDDEVETALTRSLKLWNGPNADLTPVVEPSDGWWPISSGMRSISVHELDALRLNIARTWQAEGKQIEALWWKMPEETRRHLIRSVCPHMPEDIDDMDRGSRPQLYKLFLSGLNCQELINGRKPVEGMRDYGRGWMRRVGPRVATIAGLVCWALGGCTFGFLMFALAYFAPAALGAGAGALALAGARQGSLPQLASALHRRGGGGGGGGNPGGGGGGGPGGGVSTEEAHDLELIRKAARAVLAPRVRGEADGGLNPWALPAARREWVWVASAGGARRRGAPVTEEDRAAPGFDYRRMEQTYEICEQTEWEFHRWRCFNLWKTCAVIIDEIRRSAFQRADGYTTSSTSCLVCRDLLSYPLATTDTSTSTDLDKDSKQQSKTIAGKNKKKGGHNNNKTKGAYFCPECKVAAYCSKECCEKDWPQHQVSCYDT